MNEDLLYSLGFSKYKAQLCLALLKLQKASVPEIARKANVPANKAYGEMDSLYREGFASIVSKKPLVYKANDPKLSIGSKIEEKISELSSLKEKLKDFEAQKQESREMTIIYGRRNFFEKMKQELKECKNSVEATVGSFKLDEELLETEALITKQGVKMRFLGPNEKALSRLIKSHKNAGVQIRHASIEKARFTIFDEKLIALRMHDIDEKNYFSIWIESQALAQILLSYFNALWEKASAKE